HPQLGVLEALLDLGPHPVMVLDGAGVVLVRRRVGEDERVAEDESELARLGQGQLVLRDGAPAAGPGIGRDVDALDAYATHHQPQWAALPALGAVAGLGALGPLHVLAGPPGVGRDPLERPP